MAAIPFENLDVATGRGVDVDLDAVQAKLVDRRRGGYCYEHGVLFAAALDRIGFRVDRLLARIGPAGGQPRPRTHMTLHVSSEQGSWLADVGFGAGLLEPLPWADDEPHRQGRWTYQLARTGEREWELGEVRADARRGLYHFSDEPQHAVDVVMANHFTSTHPSSPFVRQIVVMRKSDDEHRRLLGRRLTISRPDAAEDERELTDEEIATALRDDFGIPLTKASMDAVITTLHPPSDGS